MHRAAVAFIALGAAAIAHAQVDTAILRPVGYHPGPIAYYNAPYFANALYEGGEWLSFTGSEFGSSINFNSDQFENGYPKFLQGAQKLRAIVFGLNIDNPFRPPGWPSRARLGRGRIVVMPPAPMEPRISWGPRREPAESVTRSPHAILCARAIECRSRTFAVTRRGIFWISVLKHPRYLCDRQSHRGARDGGSRHLRWRRMRAVFRRGSTPASQPICTSTTLMAG